MRQTFYKNATIVKAFPLKDDSTKHTVIDALLTKARSEKHINILKGWFEGG